jgi:hypothetical protein
MSTSPEARRVILATFQDLLPKSMMFAQRRGIAEQVSTPGTLAYIIYTAATHAGYLRGWAEGYGGHRGAGNNPDCPYPSHAPDCNCKGMGGDR